MAGEAKLKLSVDTSQAQQQIKLIDRQLNNLGRGSSGVSLGESSQGIMPSSDQAQGIDVAMIERLINAQERFLDSFTDYISHSRQSTQTISTKLDKINDSLKGNGKGGYKGSGGSSTGENGADGIKSILGKIATGATVASAVKSLISYARQGATSSASSEMQAYNVFNTTDLYDGHYDTARNVQSDVGSPYGYNVYETLGVQSKLIGRTGVSSQENITADSISTLKTARALSVGEGELANAFGSFYQTGTYGNGDMSRFANLFATSIQEAGMVGREDEQLEVLESINSLLDKNLTTITESQYESALGLYSLFSSSSQSLSGSDSAGIVQSLNEAISGGGNTMDIALGKYSGKFGSLWEFEKQKEKGVTDPENLKSIISYFESQYGLDMESNTGKSVLQKFLQSNSADLSTEEIETIVNNLGSIKSGEYSNMFSNAIEGSKGSNYIDKQYGDYTDSKLEDMKTYEAESLNAQERIGDAVNEATSVLKSLYNDLPQWMQNATNIGGTLLGGAASMAVNLGSMWLGNSLFNNGIKGTAEKIFGSGIGNNIPKGATGGFTDYAKKIVDAYESGGDVEGLLKGLSKDGKVTDEMFDWADELSHAYNTGADDAADELIKQGYKSFGKNLGKGVANSADDVLSGVGKGASILGKAGKVLGLAGTVLEVGNTAIGTYKAIQEEDYETAYKEVGGGAGSIAGGWAGAAGGASLGATIGAVGGPIGVAVGTILGGIIGGIGGSFGGEALGEAGGELLYDATHDDLEDASSATLYNTNAIERNTEAIKQSSGGLYYNAPYSPEYIQNSVIGNSLNRSLFRPHAIGADYIPYDGYLAELHKGETVLDAHTASEYRNGTLGSNSNSSVLEIKLSGSVDGMTNENQNRIVTAVVNQIKHQIGSNSVMNQLAFNSVRIAN